MANEMTIKSRDVEHGRDSLELPFSAEHLLSLSFVLPWNGDETKIPYLWLMNSAFTYWHLNPLASFVSNLGPWLICHKDKIEYFILYFDVGCAAVGGRSGRSGWF